MGRQEKFGRIKFSWPNFVPVRKALKIFDLYVMQQKICLCYLQKSLVLFSLLTHSRKGETDHGKKSTGSLDRKHARAAREPQT
jgi:hypothetical protein